MTLASLLSLSAASQVYAVNTSDWVILKNSTEFDISLKDGAAIKTCSYADELRAAHGTLKAGQSAILDCSSTVVNDTNIVFHLLGDFGYIDFLYTNPRYGDIKLYGHSGHSKNYTNNELDWGYLISYSYTSDPLDLYYNWYSNQGNGLNHVTAIANEYVNDNKVQYKNMQYQAHRVGINTIGMTLGRDIKNKTTYINIGGDTLTNPNDVTYPYNTYPS